MLRALDKPRRLALKHLVRMRSLQRGMTGMLLSATAAAAPNSYHALSREIFRQLIEINTTVNEGSTKASQALAARLKSAGFSSEDLHLVGPRPQNLNLVVRYRGEPGRKPVLFIGHLDVLDALREDWSFDPFTFLEQDGYFYGRGTMDNKSEDADIVTNLIRLKKEGFRPNRDIIVALTDDEEAGPYNGVQWLLANRRDLVDAEYCISSDGGGGQSKNGTPMLMTVQTSEKTYVTFQLEVRNKGGHSSRPVKDNAIYHLAEALMRLAQFDFPTTLNETTRAFFERTAGAEAEPIKAKILAALKMPMDRAALNELGASSSYFNALLRTTCVATMLSGGHAENALPQVARATVNCRLLPGDSPENVQATLKQVFNDDQIIVTMSGEPRSSPLSPLRKDVLDLVGRLTARMWPGVATAPVMATGASDGKYLRIAGIPVYGVSGLFVDTDDNRAHGKDERIGVRQFYDSVDFMYQFVKSLTSGTL
jgi:acetylornithine deacetylase/succinyl-diaminopimelate desuccinylase-like protein